MTEAEQIARGLTEAQRQILLRAREPTHLRAYWQVEAGRSKSALKRRGLIRTVVYNNQPIDCGIRDALTPLGLAVRHHLLTTNAPTPPSPYPSGD